MTQKNWGCRYFSISEGKVVYNDIWPTTVPIPSGVKVVVIKPTIVEDHLAPK